MKQILEYIISKSSKRYVIKATDDTIKQIVKNEYKRLGNNSDFNHIDVSKCTTFYMLFHSLIHSYTEYGKTVTINEFDCDVSKWNVSSVRDFSFAFSTTQFNGDLSNWDMSSAYTIDSMFNYCLKFEGKGLENWKDRLSKLTSATYAFQKCPIKGDFLKNWQLPKLKQVQRMFSECKNLYCDLSKWSIKDIKNTDDYSQMFYGCIKMSEDLYPQHTAYQYSHMC